MQRTALPFVDPSRLPAGTQIRTIDTPAFPGSEPGSAFSRPARKAGKQLIIDISRESATPEHYRYLQDELHLKGWGGRWLSEVIEVQDDPSPEGVPMACSNCGTTLTQWEGALRHTGRCAICNLAGLGVPPEQRPDGVHCRDCGVRFPHNSPGIGRRCADCRSKYVADRVKRAGAVTQAERYPELKYTTTDASGTPKPHAAVRVLVEVSGGVVNNIKVETPFSNRPVVVVLVDWDNIKANPAEGNKIGYMDDPTPEKDFERRLIEIRAEIADEYPDPDAPKVEITTSNPDPSDTPDPYDNAEPGTPRTAADTAADEPSGDNCPHCKGPCKNPLHSLRKF